MHISVSTGNKKLKNTLIFSLPAVLTCPNATTACKAFCYALKAQRMYPNTKQARERNFLISQNHDEFVKQMNGLLAQYRKKRTREGKRKFQYFRIHESGDFYNLPYFNTWMKIIENNPDYFFLAYTKSAHLKISLDKLPKNLSLKFSIDHTTKQKDIDFIKQNELIPAYTRTKQVEEIFPEAFDRKRTFQCNQTMTCGDCRVCWTKKPVSFELH